MFNFKFHSQNLPPFEIGKLHFSKFRKTCYIYILYYVFKLMALVINSENVRSLKIVNKVSKVVSLLN